MMSALHGHISDSPTLNLLYMCALSLLCPLLNLNRVSSITCSVLFSLWRLTGCSLGVAVSIFLGGFDDSLFIGISGVSVLLFQLASLN